MNGRDLPIPFVMFARRMTICRLGAKSSTSTHRVDRQQIWRRMSTLTKSERVRTHPSLPANHIPLQMLAFPSSSSADLAWPSSATLSHQSLDASSLCKIERKRSLQAVSLQGAQWKVVEGGNAVPGRSGCADRLLCESTRRQVVDGPDRDAVKMRRLSHNRVFHRTKSLLDGERPFIA